ncbi:MAG TPA: P1 family peptidase [Streptosporangiaceae bacterium]|nr:P1 family peptidase [Streptosporangiaceae bacterium]
MSGTGVRLPAGVSAGHWTDVAGRTGCTVVLAPGGAVAGVDVRGGAPGTLGTDELRPGRVVERAHAVLLTGGSAFGLAAAGGVMLYLEEHGVGHPIGGVRVPIVAGAVVFDLLNGDPRARPDAAAGYAACQAATGSPEVGAVGAGTGATVAKAGGGPPRPGGLGIASQAVGPATVAAVMVANAVGAIWDDERHHWVAPLAPAEGAPGPAAGANTTIGVVVTDAGLTREQANRVAAVAHDGIARAVRPAHTRFDGDTMFCLATGMVAAPAAAGGTGPAPTVADLVEAAAAEVVARAIADGVREGARQQAG